MKDGKQVNTIIQQLFSLSSSNFIEMFEAIKPYLKYIIDVECEVVYKNKSTQELMNI